MPNSHLSEIAVFTHSRIVRTILAAVLLLGAALGPGLAGAQELVCGSLANGYGPYDYTDPAQYETYIHRVELAHFTAEVETLKRGTTGVVMGDIDYLLRASPNHHRALYAMARYYLQHPKEDQTPVYKSADCYFDRAIRFKPDDGNVYLIYGIYLARKEFNDRALIAYNKAIELLPDSAEARYDIGLLYADMKDFANACKHAREAARLGYPLQGLETELRAAGYDPETCQAPRRASSVNN